MVCNLVVMLTYFSCYRSQFFDKDGDMAHEFYEEVILPDGHTVMQRITTDLRPQVTRNLYTKFQVSVKSTNEYL